MIEFTKKGGPEFSPYLLKRLERQTGIEMEAFGRVTSMSGTTAIFAISWCEERKIDWSLHRVHGGGYFVEKLTEKKNDT